MEFQTEFLRFCVGIIRIPIAMYHFYAAGRFFELDYLRRLKKRNETHFAVAAHDCFNSEQFWDEMRSLQSLDMEPFTVYPELSSTYVFARSPKNEKEKMCIRGRLYSQRHSIAPCPISVLQLSCDILILSKNTE